MRPIRKNLFLATVLTFALSSSGCAMLGNLLGGGGGGGGIDLSSLIPGLGLTEEAQDQGSLALTGAQIRVVNGYEIRATETLPAPSRQEGALYSSFD